MGIYPAYLLNLILLVIIIRIKKLLNNENKYRYFLTIIRNQLLIITNKCYQPMNSKILKIKYQALRLNLYLKKELFEGEYVIWMQDN
jgi:uncharacterized protein (DUF1919 family)